MSLTKILCSLLIIVSSYVLVENRSYNNGLIFYNLENQNAYLPPTISVSRGRGLAKFKYSPRGSIWSTFGRPCDCTGPLCGCCVGIKVKQYNFDQKICANVSYVSPKEEIQLEVFLNETSTAKYGVAARNPQPLCIPIMMGIPMSMCVQMSNIGIQGDNLNMCMDFLVRLASSELFEMHFQCMKMGLQGVSWVGSDGQPVIPPNEGKITDRGSDETDEYYDEELEEDKENEVMSKEKETEISKVDEKVDSNEAEEEMDYNDITEKIMDIVKEEEQHYAEEKDKENEIDKEVVKEENVFTEKLNDIESDKHVITEEEGDSTEKLIEQLNDNEIDKQVLQDEVVFTEKDEQLSDNEIDLKEPNDLSAEESKIESQDGSKENSLITEFADQTKETENNKEEEMNNTQEHNFLIITQESENDNYDSIKEQTEENAEQNKEEIINNTSQEAAEESKIEESSNMISALPTTIEEIGTDMNESNKDSSQVPIEYTEENIAEGNKDSSQVPIESTEENIAEGYGNMMTVIAPLIENPEIIKPDSADTTIAEPQNTAETFENLPQNYYDNIQSEEVGEISSSGIEKFEMLTNNREEVTTELTLNESELNNSLENLTLPVETTTARFIVANLKPTLATTVTTSETNNIDNTDNAITIATVLSTTTPMKITTTTATPDDIANTGATATATAAAATFIETNNSNDSDNSQDNDSDYKDEESDEEEEDEDGDEEDDEESIENKETITNSTISSYEEEEEGDDEESIDNQETTVTNLNISNEENEKEEEVENTTNAISNVNNVKEENDKESSDTKEILNASSSDESNSNDNENENHNPNGDDGDEDDEEEEDEDIDDNDDSYESDEHVIETTTITNLNQHATTILPSSVLNTINPISANGNHTTLITNTNSHMQTSDTDINLSSANYLLLNSSDSTRVATENSGIINDDYRTSTATNIPQSHTATAVHLPLSRKFLTLQRQHKQQQQQQLYQHRRHHHQQQH